MTIFPRSVIGTPEPPATRRKLDRVGVVLAHEVGVNTSPSGRYRSADPARVLDDARAAAAYGISAGKSWEYSYMLGLDGSIFTQAGEYMAAHCLNFNDQSAGVIFLNATDVPANDAQVAAWFEVRAHMVTIGTLKADHEAWPHYRYRSTSCPGLRAVAPGMSWPSPTGEGRLGNLIPALLTPPTPPTPPQPIEDDMTYLFHLANGDYGLRGPSGCRRVSGEEFGDTVPPRDQARQVAAGSNEEYWIAKELAAYDRSLGV